MYSDLAILASFAFFYSIVAARVQNSNISGTVIFMLFGFLIGPSVLGILHLAVDENDFRIIADLTLALVLFTDAAGADYVELRASSVLPKRMLLLGLPCAIFFGFLFAVILFDNLSLLDAAILATMLAATDAALGKAVFTDKTVPVRIREGLNIESGLNDGICVPILLVLLVFAQQDGTHSNAMGLMAEVAIHEIGIGLLVGLGVTAIGLFFISKAIERGWIDSIWRQLTVVMLTLAVFSIAQELGGSGYIASFTGGLLFGFKAPNLMDELVTGAEAAGNLMSVFVWITFGALIISLVLPELNLSMIIYAICSLTLIRMLSIFISLIGIDEPLSAKLFLGWFGPRGLASLVFVVIVINTGIPNGGFIGGVVICTVLFSVILHGISAKSFSRMLSKSLSSEVEKK